MAKRHLPVYPNLEQLASEAETLHRERLKGNVDALTDFEEFHPQFTDLAEPTVADARLVLARLYGVASWDRLVLACEMTDSIQRNDVGAVRRLITEHPELLHEDARGVPGNWGPPMSYASNLGRDEIVQMLAAAGANDVQHAFDRACLQGQIETAKWLMGVGAKVERGIVMGPCETQNANGLSLLLDLGAELCDEAGNKLAPLAMVLETYSRDPEGKHRCLELIEEHGVQLPDTPIMALHRGRIDMLADHVRADSQLLQRKFSYREIYPLELGCHTDESLGLHGTPLDGTTLLHISIDFDEMQIARWLLENGMDVNITAEVDGDGFGGHTPLFNAAVSQPHACGRQRDASMAKLLLSFGADVTVRASLRKRLRFVDDESVHRFTNVTPLEYAQTFHEPRWICDPVMKLLQERTPRDLRSNNTPKP